MPSSPRLRTTLPALVATALLWPASSARADELGALCTPAGFIASLTGNVSRGGDGTLLRMRAVDGLQCWDQLCVGDTVATGANSSVGIVSRGVLTQLGPDSAATIGETGSQTTAVDLQQGGARIIDGRESGPPGQLNALGAQAPISGGEIQANVRDTPGGRVADVCANDAPIVVNGTTVAAGQCATFAAGGLVGTGAGAGAGWNGAALDGACEPGSDHPPIAHVVPTPPVASPPPPPPNTPPLPEPPGGPPRTTCELSGGCGPPTIVNTQPFTTDPFPGMTP